LLIYWRKFPSLQEFHLRRQRAPGEDYLAAGDVAVHIVVRLASIGAVQAEIFDCAMESVGRQGSVDALALKLLSANLGAQVDGDTSRAAMLIERTSAHAGTSQAQHYRPAVVAGRGEEFALEAIKAHRAFTPCFTRALGGKAPNGARQLAHQGFIRARLERDNRVVLNSHRGAQLLGQEMAQVDRQSAAELQALRLEGRRLDRQAAPRMRERPRVIEY
jgi:hypothetical protein